MSSIKVEPIEGESPLNASPPLPVNVPTPQSTVKCEWSLKGVCACADGKCDDCQASEMEDDKDDILTTTLAVAAAPLNSLDSNETEFHPPKWEDCEEAENTGSDVAIENVKPVFCPVDNPLADGPIIEEVNPEEIKEEIPDNVEREIANKDAEINEEEGPIIEEVNPDEEFMEDIPDNVEEEGNVYQETELQVEASQVTEANSSHQPSSINQQANSQLQRSQGVIANNSEGSVIDRTEPDEETETTAVSSPSLRRSTRARKSAVNYAVLPEAEEETPQNDPNTGTSDSEESDSDESETETDSEMETDEPSETQERASIPGSSERPEDSNSHQQQIKRSRPYVCSFPDCGKSSSRQFDLDKHSLIHSGLRPFTCPTCGATFTQSGTLNRHQRNAHTNERPYVCSVCPKAFKTKGDLLRHNLLHSGSKPFTCTDCGRSFTQKSNLEQHRNGKRACGRLYAPSKSRPFSCTVHGCGKAFKVKKILVAHLLTHSTAAKAFKCTVCGGTFGRKDSLAKHRRIFH